MQHRQRMSGEEESGEGSWRSGDAPRNLRRRSPSPAGHGAQGGDRCQRRLRFPEVLKEKLVGELTLPIGLWRCFLKIPVTLEFCLSKVKLRVKSKLASEYTKRSVGQKSEVKAKLNHVRIFWNGTEQRGGGVSV